jgi:hypothetical protein
MDRRLQHALTIGAVALGALLTCAAPALAQDASTAGEKLGTTITGLAGPIVFSIGGFTALAAFFKRDIGLAFSTLVITLVVGGFIVAPESIKGFSETLWESVFADSSGVETCEDGSMPRDGQDCPVP